MKKSDILLFITAFMAFVITSCEKKNNPFTPDPNPGTGEHPVLWSYETYNGSIADIIPAIDESDNIYFSMVNENNNGVIVFAIDKNGQELWKKEVNGSAFIQGTSIEKVIYAHDKVFVATENPTGLHCLQASSGNTLWYKDYTAEYGFEWMLKTAVNNNKIYVYTGQLISGYLFALDYNGNELWIKQIATSGAAYSISSLANELYFTDGDYLYRYDDNGTSCDSVWA